GIQLGHPGPQFGGEEFAGLVHDPAALPDPFDLLRAADPALRIQLAGDLDELDATQFRGDGGELPERDRGGGPDHADPAAPADAPTELADDSVYRRGPVAPD